MGKLGKLFIVIFCLIITTLLILFFVGFFKPKAAGIFIDSTPVSDVFINGVSVGSTPFEEIREPGEITIKLVPQDLGLVDFETKVNLVSSVRTVIKREFGQDEDKSSGEIASFEKIGGKEASVSIVSIPDAAQISINGQVRGFAPYKINSITPGEHNLNISSLGYLDRDLTIKAYQGYKLTVVVKLAQGTVQPDSDIAIKTDDLVIKTDKVKILETPNNFLRVRKDPSMDSQEIARVTSGSTYPLIEEDSDTGWFKIEYQEGGEGWVSNEYSEKVEE